MSSTRKNAHDLAAWIAATSPDEGLRREAERIRRRLESIPMTDILGIIPGDSITAKCKLLGVTRPTYYAWMKGINRPYGKAARRLAEITGFSADEIRGVSSGAPRSARQR